MDDFCHELVLTELCLVDFQWEWTMVARVSIFLDKTSSLDALNSTRSNHHIDTLDTDVNIVKKNNKYIMKKCQ